MSYLCLKKSYDWWKKCIKKDKIGLIKKIFLMKNTLFDIRNFMV